MESGGVRDARSNRGRHDGRATGAQAKRLPHRVEWDGLKPHGLAASRTGSRPPGPGATGLRRGRRADGWHKGWSGPNTSTSRAATKARTAVSCAAHGRSQGRPGFGAQGSSSRRKVGYPQEARRAVRARLQDARPENAGGPRMERAEGREAPSRSDEASSNPQVRGYSTSESGCSLSRQACASTRQTWQCSWSWKAWRWWWPSRESPSSWSASQAEDEGPRWWNAQEVEPQ